MILYDFNCDTCKIKFEALARSDEQQTQHDVCGNMADRILSAVHIGTMNDPAAKAAALRQRSYNHTINDAKSNQDKLAAKMGGTARPRAQAKWNIRSQKKAK